MGAGPDLTARRKDGLEFPVEIGLNPIQLEGDTFVLGTIIDLTARKEAERKLRDTAAALRRSEASYRQLFEQATYGIYRSSIDGKFVTVNPALARMLRYSSPEELLVVDMARDVYANFEDRNRLVEEVRSSGRFDELEVGWRCKDGSAITVRLAGQAIPVRRLIAVQSTVVHRVLYAGARSKAVAVHALFNCIPPPRNDLT